jgi:hypothetical protein
MPRPLTTLALLLSIAAASCDVAMGQPTPGGGGLFPFNDNSGDDPDPMPEFSLDPSPARPDPAPGRGSLSEELTAPQGAAAQPTEQEASRLVQENTVENPWLPLCDDAPSGWLPELAIPPGCLDCTCDGKLPGKPCQVWRSFQRPTHPSIDPDCVACVKEPCLGYEKVHYTTEAVVQKCFVSEAPFKDKECADGRCIEKSGTKIVKQLHPCKTQVKLFYWKPIVEYRDVYYYISCEACGEEDTVVQRGQNEIDRSVLRGA